jgi:hypothetical protein
MYNNQKRSSFIGLEIYLKGTGKRAPKFEFQASGKTMFKDTLTKKKYTAYQFGNWLQEPHVIAKVKAGCELRLGSVDLESDIVDKYTNSNLNRKFVWFFIDPKSPTQNIDGLKPISQTMPQQMPSQVSVDEDMDDSLPPY